MRPLTLRDELEKQGLVVLDVAASHAKRNQLIVYLHGPAGQWVEGHAQTVISSVPGVVSVTKSQRSDVIFVVSVETPDRDERRAP